MKRDLITASLAVLAMTLLLGIAYPLVITGIGQVAFPGNANGQQVHVGHTLVGSKLIGQSFAGHPQYFQTRPSATTPPDNAAASTFSNLGPNNVATEKEIAANLAAYLKLEKPYDASLTVAQVPVDAVNTSASGIDPQISVANADIQSHRVAAVRRLPLATVHRLISDDTAGRGLGVFGEPAVNVLELNLALDRLSAGGTR